MTELDTCQAKIFDLMLDDEKSTDEAIQEEMAAADEYKSKYHAMMLHALKFSEVSPSVVPSTSQAERRHTFKLPKIKLMKFNGNVKVWLCFWS